MVEVRVQLNICRFEVTPELFPVRLLRYLAAETQMEGCADTPLCFLRQMPSFEMPSVDTL